MWPRAFKNRVLRVAPLALVLAEMTSAAEPSAGKPAPAVATEAQPCPVGERGATLETACELSRGLGRLDGPILVAAGTPTVESSTPKAGELATRVAEGVSAAVGATLPPLRGASSLGAARARASAARAFVFVSI